MNAKQLFNKHYYRLVAEGVIKSVFMGLIIGFGANFIAGFFAWIFDFGGIWFPIGVGVGAAVISGTLFYFLRFKPDAKEVAARLDRLGLQERMVTMLELKNDSSYIAELQRENARVHLAKASNKKIRFRFSTPVIVLVIVATIVGASMTTVVGLADGGVIPTPDEIFPDDPFENHIPVTYLADEGGELEGETDQLVAPGGSTTTVVAVADDGWMFIGWDDGYGNPDRHEEGVTEECVFIAMFEQVVDGEGGGEDGDADGNPGGAEGDKADDVPGGGDASAESEQPGAGEKGDGSGADGESDGGQGSTEEEGEGKGDGQGLGAGGKWQENNQFLDGKTYYRDYLDIYYQMAQEIFEANGEIPPEYKEFYETYFSGI